MNFHFNSHMGVGETFLQNNLELNLFFQNNSNGPPTNAIWIVWIIWLFKSLSLSKKKSLYLLEFSTLLPTGCIYLLFFSSSLIFTSKFLNIALDKSISFYCKSFSLIKLFAFHECNIEDVKIVVLLQKWCISITIFTI